MGANLLTVELARNIDGVLALAAFGFSVFDYPSKRVDVGPIKKELDLRRAQLTSQIVSQIEVVLGPLITAGQPIYDLGDGLAAPPLAMLDDSTRSKITDILRVNESCFVTIRILSRLPRQLRLLNAAVFWCVASVAIISLACAAVLLIVPVTQSHIWILLAIPIAASGITLTIAGIRHIKVQHADKYTLENNP